MSIKNSQNTFMEGIKGDFSPLDASSNAATDIVNGGILSLKGNQMIMQSMKSNSPVFREGKTLPEFKEFKNSAESIVEIKGLSPLGSLEFSVTSSVLDANPTKTVVVKFYSGELSKGSYKEESYEIRPEDYLAYYKIYDILDDEDNIPKYIKITSIGNQDKVVNHNIKVRLTYFIENTPVKLPAENKIFGVKTYNDISYIISGKPTDVLLSKEASNDRADKPQVVIGDESDFRNDIGNIKTEVEPSTSYSPTTVTLWDTQVGGPISGWDTHTGSNDDASLQSNIVDAGRYSGYIEIISEIDPFTTRATDHILNFTLMYQAPDGSSEVVKQEINIDRYEEYVIEEPYNFSYTIDEGKEGGRFYVMADYRIRGSDRIKINTKVKLGITQTPSGAIDTTQGITLTSIDVTDATSKLHENGKITIVKEDSGDSGTFEVALNNQDWTVHQEGGVAEISGLAPGQYTYYVYKRNDDTGYQYVYKGVIGVGTQVEVPNIKIKGEITEFNSLQDFKVNMTFTDNFREYRTDISKRYRVGYYYYEDGSIQEGGVFISNGSILNKEFNVGLNERSIIILFVEAIDSHVVDEQESTYTRRCELEIPITEEIEKNRYSLEVGSFPSPDYNPLTDKGDLVSKYFPFQNLDNKSFSTNKIHLTGDNYVDMEIQPSYDGSVNVIFADKGNPLRIINSGFSVKPDRKYEIIRRTGANNTNRYNSSNVAIATKNVQSLSRVPDIELKRVNNSGGNLEVGMMKLYFALGTPDGNETDIVEETGEIPIYHGDTFGGIKGGVPGDRANKSLSFSVTNVDEFYDYISVYCVLNTGEEVSNAKSFKVDKRFYLNPDPIESNEFTITGFEPISIIDENELSVKKSYLSSVGTITQVQNRLFTANVSSKNVDYNKLFKAVQRVYAVPSTGPNKINLSSFYDKWNAVINQESNFFGFGNIYTNQKISEKSLMDLNKSKQNGLNGDVIDLINAEGFHNPSIVEKLSGYWPAETYKLGMCLVLDDDTVTDPVPVTSGDFIDVENAPGMEDSAYNDTRQAQFNGNNNWSDDMNNIGLLRFPKVSKNNELFYPKFKFKKAELIDAYPELFSRVKGFFFVRGERRKDVILSGELGAVFSAITEVNPLPDPLDYEHAGVISLGERVSLDRSVLPYVSQWVLKGITKLGANYYPTGTENITAASGEDKSILNDAHLRVVGVDDFDTFQTTNIENGEVLYRYALRSGDLFSDKARIAASFNGNSYGLLPVHQFEIIRAVAETSPVTEDTRLLSNYFSVQKLGNKRIVGFGIGDDGPQKAIFDYVSYGSGRRTGGGFASAIPYKAYHEGDPMEEGRKIFPTGMWESYIGISSPGQITSNYAFIYPSVNGPITKNALKSMYNSDESTAYTAITPRYSFDEFDDKEVIDLIGTRGDCRITQSVINIAHGDLGKIGSHDSRRVDLKDPDTNEHNSYRAREIGTSSVLTQHSDYLTYVRHPKVEDPVESAKYGKARGFYPLDSKGSGYLAPTMDNKMASTEGFNKGYGNNFTGRKYFSISKNSPFVQYDNENTIQYSEKYDSDSFFNGYRSFSSFNKGDYGRDLGPITKIENIGGNLVSVHARGVSMIGINDQAVMNTEQGTDIRFRSLNVLSDKPTIISSEFGSSWMRSIKKTDNSIYGVDVNRSLIWAMTGKGLQIISAGSVNKMLATFLSGFQGKKEVPGDIYIATHYDTITNDVIFTFYNKDSNVTKKSFDMDPDVFNMLDAMTDEERALWAYVDTEVIPEDQLSEAYEKKIIRKELYDQYNEAVDDNIMKNFTLVFSENSKTWTTRLSYSPEFMFNSGNALYSVNNKRAITTIPDILSDRFLESDVDSHLIWQHALSDSEIPTYGSYYGKDPLFELEFVINDDQKFEKILETIDIIGNEVMPDKIQYEVSDDAPWLKMLIDTDGNNYSDWEEMKQDFLMKAYNSDHLINPARYYIQELYDRRSTSITRANYQYTNGYNHIKVGKNLKTLYDFNTDSENTFPDNATARKHFVTKLRDKYFKVRLIYTSGKYINIKAITSEYKITL